MRQRQALRQCTILERAPEWVVQQLAQGTPVRIDVNFIANMRVAQDVQALRSAGFTVEFTLDAPSLPDSHEVTLASTFCRAATA